ncbi:MAG: FtsW/RodA/SpoVE family cell cycle protein [Bacteroidota bacterium]|uniref:FtsW/RodA/SpoVE family cell cycle protein n=1 Tax=Nonlabens tegetincola TaxID=323273 RepID=UPI0005AA8909|nr:FtsW/RodA/SpoVE family cell cycle protein [Nonlabens tegetincola]MEE2801915.1 FtsW/RodA/SpoVE family cell cycle protein [Bacteroidota bacterium]
MLKLSRYISGDLFLWSLIVALLVFSIIPVYSASANLAYLGKGTGDTSRFLIRHLGHIIMGLIAMWAVHKTPYRLFNGLSVLLIYPAIVLLVITALQGTTMGGANASRWITIPGIGMQLQTSTLVFVILMVYVAKYLSNIAHKTITFKQSLLPLWLPVGLTLLFVLPSNFSTTALIFIMVLALCFIGGYPWKYLLGIIGVGIVALSLFILTAKAFPDLFPNRVDTWISRIENFSGSGTADTNYQTERALAAISEGGIPGVGPGKSMLRPFLPQSSSDFIYAIIIEEFGFIGAFGIVIMYLLILFRLVVITKKAKDIFGRLVVIGVGFPIIFQACINMAVAVNLMPVTGQTLPFISSGGTSILMSCLAMGIVLSVSASKDVKEPLEETKEEDMNPLDVLSETI